ncbi:MAG: protein kinase [Dehalococcoidia bacterium]|nr:protein kinase [Dehalococcoidia bacterium]
MEGRLVKNRYRLDTRLGEGTMGVVYKAFDLAEQRVVAIKIADLTTHPEAAARFQHEARTMLGLSHPHIVAVYDAGQDDGVHYMVMEYLDGRSFGEMLPLAIPDAVGFAIQIGSALEYAHRQGIIHRDIKPANLMIIPTGGGLSGPLVKVLDFGLARRLHDQFELNESGSLVGTAAYISPEQALGQRIDVRSDLYSLGVVLFEMLTGQSPFPGDNFVSVIYQHINESPPSPRRINPGIPISLEQVVLRLLRKDPAERFNSAGSLISSLRAVFVELAALAASGIAPVPGFEGPAVAMGPPLIGREHEFRVLTDVVRRVRDGASRFVLIAGEQGIGKTRLAQEAIALARLNRFQVASAICYQQEGGFPYQPFIDSIRNYVTRLSWQDVEVLRRATESCRGELLSLVPELARIYRKSAYPSRPTAGPEQDKELFFEAISQFIAGASQMSPLILFIDDLQWADAASVKLLEYIARRNKNCPILVMAAYRPSESSQHLLDFLNAPSDERLHRLVNLDQLSPEQSSRLIEALLGVDPISPEVPRRVYAETEGNPFFIVETIRHLVEEGFLAKTDGEWQVTTARDLQLSASVLEVVERRLAHLPNKMREALSIGAVIGRAFSLSLLRETAPSLDTDLSETIARGLASGLIKERSQRVGGIFDFSHSLIREVLYSSLSADRRRFLHERVAETIERLDDPNFGPALGELAYHFSHGTNQEKAIRYNHLAGQQAASVYASEEAFNYWSTARDLVRQQGHSDHVLDILEGLGQMSVILGRFQVAVDAYRQAIQKAESLKPPATTRILKLRGEISGAYERLGLYDEALSELERGVTEPLESETVESAYLHGQLAVIYSRRGEIDLAMHHANEDLKIAEGLGNEEETALACTILYKLHSLQGDWEGARKLTERALEIWVRRDDIYRQEWNYLNLGTALVALGHWEEAENNWICALDISQRIQYTQGVVQNSLNLGLLSLRRGQLPQAEAFLVEALVLARVMGHVYLIARTTMRNAEMKQQQGEMAAAMELFAEAETILRGLGHKKGLSELLWLTADAYIEQGLLLTAERTAEESLSLANQPDGYEEIGNASRVLARVMLKQGDRQKAAVYLERANLCFDKLRDDYGLAQLRLDQADFLAGSGMPGDLAKARKLLEGAIEVFNGLQAVPYITKVESALHKLSASYDLPPR